MTIKTHSNRSNAKRALVQFRDRHPAMTDVAVAVIGPDGSDRFALMATIPADADDAYALPLEELGIDWMRANTTLPKSRSTIENASDLESDPLVKIGKNVAADKRAERKAAAEASRAEVAKAKAEVKAAKVSGKVVRAKAEREAEKPAKVAKAKKESTKVLRADGLVVGSKAAALVDAVLEKGGKTMPELLEVCGWAQCRPFLFKQAEKAGVEITTDKSTKPARYVGRYVRQAA